MEENVLPVEPTIRWEPNAPQAVLITTDLGHASLGLASHPDDHDDRSVVIVWEGVRSATMGSPSDEAISGHRLYDKGLRDVAIGLVEGSELIASLELQNRVHPFHDPEWYANMQHWVVRLKESTVEVVAASMTMVHVDGSPAFAAIAATQLTDDEAGHPEPTVV